MKAAASSVRREIHFNTGLTRSAGSSPTGSRIHARSRPFVRDLQCTESTADPAPNVTPGYSAYALQSVRCTIVPAVKLMAAFFQIAPLRDCSGPIGPVSNSDSENTSTVEPVLTAARPYSYN